MMTRLQMVSVATLRWFTCVLQVTTHAMIATMSEMFGMVIPEDSKTLNQGIYLKSY